ncbi:hypothetical protein Ciccas_012910 [Cichlidogyrus casuarinus]|uniref:BPTI/Kunitz inhibitor domain-containing protein n=1 Tax=Cichlidogyrus casuarinus TaxID=1844966 RepID=A0ABD2PM01_9PLAT
MQFCCVYPLNPICNEVIESECGCLKIVHAWIWDSKISACKITYYYGCRFRRKGFLCKKKCEAACLYKPEPNPNVSLNPICKQPIDKGIGGGCCTRWAYNMHKGVCEQFFFGGSDGNDNKFYTEEECEQVCPPSYPVVPRNPICNERIDKGTGMAYVLSWGYDTHEGACVQFFYQGCHGNRNRFSCKKQCDKTCL